MVIHHDYSIPDYTGLEEVPDSWTVPQGVILEQFVDRVLLIDASPSMELRDLQPSRLIAAVSASQAYIDQLAENQPETWVGLVAYGRYAYILCDPMPAANRAALKASLNNIVVISGTNITAALDAARTMLNPLQPGQAVLLGDGAHNCGAHPSATADALKQFATLECVGIGTRGGDDFDEELLMSLASARSDGTKRYRWIRDPVELKQHYRRLAGRLSRQ